MVVLTGGREQAIEQYRALLEGAGFPLNEVIPTAAVLWLPRALDHYSNKIIKILPLFPAAQ